MASLERRVVRERGASIALALACVGGSCGRSPEEALGASSQAGACVLLITVDTLRLDAVGAFGGPPGLTPNLDALADAGVRFTQARTPAPITLPAHASLLTGRLPHEHGARDNGSFRLPDGATTLAEVLGAEGYATAAFVGAQVLDGSFGLDQGFDVYDDVDVVELEGGVEANERSGDDVVRAAETWLRGRDDGTWFLWVHLFDPHAPYAPPREDHARARTALVAARSSWATDPARVGYAGDEHAADRAIGHLLRAARDAAGRRALLVAAVSDHGEGLGDHGESTHGFRLHDTTLRVPLLLSGGTLPAATVDQPVSTADLAPTLLALVGAPALPGRGASLLGRAPAGPPTGNASYSEATHPYLNCGWAPAWSLAVGRRRLVDAGRSRLYDTAAALDAPEQDLAASEPEVVADLFAQLLALGADAGPSARVHPSAATSAALGQLGYGGGGVARTDAPLLPGWRGEGLLDPDRGLELWQRMQTLLLRARSEGLQSAEIGRAAEALLEEDPGNPTFRMQVATLRMARGEYASAAALLALALELFESSVARGHLGTCLVKLGRSSEALQVFEAAVELHPGDVMNRIKYAVLLRNVGRSQDADHQFDRALERLARNHPQRATYERLRSSN